MTPHSQVKSLTKWIEIDLKAILSNARFVRKHLAPQSLFCGVVKANAYGHGLAPVGRVLAQSGHCAFLGVWSLGEARELLGAIGPKRIPVMLLAPSMDSFDGLCWGVKTGVIFTVDNWANAAKLSRAALAVGKKTRVLLDLDFGLGRWGIEPALAEPLAGRLLRHSAIELFGIATHVDYVPGLDKTEAETKLSHFLRLAKSIEASCLQPLLKTCANTTIFLDFPKWHLDLARIGNLLYGINPTSAPRRLRNAWRFKARVLHIRRLRRGEAVGYGGEFMSLRPMRIASVACGFADGLTMEPGHRMIRLRQGTRYWALYKGQELPIVGRVGIGHALLDATRAPALKVGDAVELPVRRTAAHAGIARIYIS